MRRASRLSPGARRVWVTGRGEKTLSYAVAFRDLIGGETKRGLPVTVDQSLVGTFTEFVAEVQPRLMHALAAIYGSDLGREATAEALAYGWEHWERIRDMENPAGYLYSAGRNSGRRLKRPRSWANPGLPRVPGRLPWVEPGLPKAISRLSDRQRQAVVLVHAFGYSHQEVADLLGVTKATVQTHAERGLARLRTKLGGTT
jgi:RNA polymerase sigma-70 factor (ECF subfamily)